MSWLALPFYWGWGSNAFELHFGLARAVVVAVAVPVAIFVDFNNGQCKQTCTQLERYSANGMMRVILSGLYRPEGPAARVVTLQTVHRSIIITHSSNAVCWVQTTAILRFVVAVSPGTCRESCTPQHAAHLSPRTTAVGSGPHPW